MKKFYLFLTALLLSLGAFAQSGATLRGDVNGDGRVDVEDVTSLVDIILSGENYGYFYFGTTQPTAENYQTLSGVVASYTSIGDAIGATASIDAGQTVYMLCPASWMKSKKVILEDGAGSTYNFIEDIDAETVPGYVIYRTQAWEEATDLALNFEIVGGDEYYWYAGQTDPSSMDSIDPIVTSTTEGGGWYELGSTLPTSIDQLIKGGQSGNVWYVAVPVDSHLVPGSSADPDTSVTTGSIKTFGTVDYQIYIYEGVTGTRYSFELNQ